MPARSSAHQYGSVAITIHWLSAALIVALLATGFLASGQADDTAKAALLRAHVPFGFAILVLTVLRAIWWLVIDRHPAPLADQPRWQKLTASVVHYALYVIMLAAAASGIATVVLSGALPAIFQGGALPDFSTVPPRFAHTIVPRLMLGLLALHVGAALYHQFVLRDQLMARIGLGSLLKRERLGR